MEASNAWTLALAGVAIGLVIGYLLGRAGRGNQEAMRKELDGAHAELARYKEQVTEHFETTADLVNGLTEQYRQVHQHLAAGAQTLCNDQRPGEALQASLQPRISSQDIPTVTDAVENEDAEEQPQPPRDYAPKTADQEGTLSDTYGIKRNAEENDDEVQAPADPSTPSEDEEPRKEEKQH
ncbi:YhcB family protein [Marinobacterium sp. YM272]|uniref:YhcB family protein n=1 Tax=Marinobacterium sp. YM272 TaxID=3421654 RepID=UPI003D7FB6F3